MPQRGERWRTYLPEILHPLPDGGLTTYQHGLDQGIRQMADGMYLWIKAIHVISVMAWMAGLLYLPRLFVYHCAAETGSVQSETFKVMERRLMRAIMNPAMISSWIFGLILVSMQAELQWWIYAKIALVLAMSGIHGAMSSWRKAFESDRNTKSALFFRVMNEVPTLLMIVIVILVIVRPF
jgi:putative membrane protein